MIPITHVLPSKTHQSDILYMHSNPQMIGSFGLGIQQLGQILALFLGNLGPHLTNLHPPHPRPLLHNPIQSCVIIPQLIAFN